VEHLRTPEGHYGGIDDFPSQGCVDSKGTHHQRSNVRWRDVERLATPVKLAGAVGKSGAGEVMSYDFAQKAPQPIRFTMTISGGKSQTIIPEIIVMCFPSWSL
jgi:hypothetical protein